MCPDTGESLSEAVYPASTTGAGDLELDSGETRSGDRDTQDNSSKADKEKGGEAVLGALLLSPETHQIWRRRGWEDCSRSTRSQRQDRDSTW